MCGIVGIHGAHDPAWLAAMNDKQRHRGPDGTGSFASAEFDVGIAMRRLAIIDIVGGAQPRVSTDRRYALVYNGEIYNASELRSALEAQGVRFESDHSDTEVLFQLLIREGTDCLARLNGMFAFAFLDLAKGELLLARDRFGIKPLHYAHSDGRFAFASEIKSLLALPYLSREPDHEAAFHYLSLHYVPGEQSAYRAIRRVPPGAWLRRDLRTGATRTGHYWRLRFEPDHSPTRGDWRAAIGSELKAAVGRWAWSDVPVSISLSGGLDSSAIAGFAAEQGLPVRAFSLGFVGTGEEAWNELPLARKVATRWGLPHDEIELEPDALIDALPTMAESLDEPYGGGLPSWFVFQGMSRTVKVGLTGTGGDEMFGNYGKWRGLEARWFGRCGRRQAIQIDRARFRDSLFDRYYYATDAWKRQLFVNPPTRKAATSDLLFDRFHAAASEGAADVRDAWAVTDIATQLSDEFLLMTDRFSMAHGLEARTPFLDNGFVDLVCRIPARDRTSPRDLKGLLREAVSPMLPPELLAAPKRGFVIPLGRWMRGRLRPLVEERLGDDALRRQGLFRPEAVAAIRDTHLSGVADHTPRLWALLMYQLWAAR